MPDFGKGDEKGPEGAIRGVPVDAPMQKALNVPLEKGRTAQQVVDKVLREASISPFRNASSQPTKGSLSAISGRSLSRTEAAAAPPKSHSKELDRGLSR
jgi:hypothetical protein